MLTASTCPSPTRFIDGMAMACEGGRAEGCKTDRLPPDPSLPHTHMRIRDVSVLHGRTAGSLQRRCRSCMMVAEGRPSVVMELSRRSRIADRGRCHGVLMLEDSGLGTDVHMLRTQSRPCLHHLRDLPRTRIIRTSIFRSQHRARQIHKSEPEPLETRYSM